MPEGWDGLASRLVDVSRGSEVCSICSKSKIRTEDFDSALIERFVMKRLKRFAVCLSFGTLLGVGSCLTEIRDTVVPPPEPEECVFSIGGTDIVVPCTLLD